MLNWFSRRSGSRRAAALLYRRIVAQSRLPVFYAEFGVPDTLEGRFELLTLHMFLALNALRSGEGRHPVAQPLVDAFFADMDAAMREMGVGDLAVPKRMRALAAAFHERLQDYRGGAERPDGLAPIIARHILKGPEPRAAARLAAYVEATLAAAARRSSGAVEAADAVAFAAIPGQPF